MEGYTLFGWSYEKVLNYPVRFLKLKEGPNYSDTDTDEYAKMKYNKGRQLAG